MRSQCCLLLVYLVLRCFTVGVFAQEKPWRKRNGLIRRLFRRERTGQFRPVVVDDFLTPEQAEFLLNRYEPLLRESLQYKDEQASRSKYRTSRSIRLPPLGDTQVFELERQAAQLAGNFSHNMVEDFQLACYYDNELYGLHRDDNEKAEANRAATVLVYLYAPEHGGSTLFTLRPLEDERDLDTKQPLRTEAAALKLFHHYCQSPSKQFLVVEPVVGRAVTWPNWRNETFIPESTHGACPVVQGHKCVIQQWIQSGSVPQPLRSNATRAIVPLGADVSYRGETCYTAKSLKCLEDVSTQEGRYLDPICIKDKKKSSLQVLSEENGPLKGVGAMRIEGKGFLPTTVHELSRDGLTIMFWVARIHPGMTLLSVDGFSLCAVEGGRLELMVDGNKDAKPIELLNSYDEVEWLWVVVSYLNSKSAHARVYSKKGKVLGWASIEMDTCDDGDSCRQTSGGEADVELRFFHSTESTLEENTNGTAFVRAERRTDQVNEAAFVASSSERESPQVSVDASFLLIHDGLLNDEEAGLLRKQAKRYDIHT